MVDQIQCDHERRCGHLRGPRRGHGSSTACSHTFGRERSTAIPYSDDNPEILAPDVTLDSPRRAVAGPFHLLGRQPWSGAALNEPQQPLHRTRLPRTMRGPQHQRGKIGISDHVPSTSTVRRQPTRRDQLANPKVGTPPPTGERVAELTCLWPRRASDEGPDHPRSAKQIHWYCVRLSLSWSPMSLPATSR